MAIDKIRLIERLLGTGVFSDDIAFDATRCTGVRGSRASCRRCVQVCPVQALSLGAGAVHIDHGACTHCGACIAVCPTQALESGWLPWPRLLERAIRATVRTGSPVVACTVLLDEAEARDAGPGGHGGHDAGNGDADGLAAAGAGADAGRDAFDGALASNVSSAGIVELPCLERVDEALLMAMAAAGAQRIVLAHGDCQHCRVGCKGVVREQAVQRTQAMLEAVDRRLAIVQTRRLPFDGASPHNAAGPDADISRRQMLADVGAGARKAVAGIIDELATQVNLDAPARALGLLSPESPLAQASRGQACELSLGALALSHNDGDAAEAVERLQGRVLESRIFGQAHIDGRTCVNCFLCVAYCPSAAIVKIMDGPRVQGFRINPWLCTQCSACTDVCRPHAIGVRPQVELTQLLTHRSTDILYADWQADTGHNAPAESHERHDSLK